MSWKSVGGINYKQKNQYVRATNFQIDSIVPTQSIGKKDTTAFVEGDLFFQDGVKLYSTRKEIDSNGLYAHYPFNTIVPSGDYIFYNESQNPNINISDSHLKESKAITMGGSSYTFAEKSPKIYVDISYGNTLHLEPRSSLLYTDASFNPSQQITNDVLSDEFKSMTMNCWIFVDTPTASTPDTGFLLFGLDTINLENTFTNAVGRNRIDGQIDHLTPSFYFFCPGYGHNDPQIYWTEDVSNAMITGNARASAKSSTPLVYNSWNMITLIVRNREVELYRNGELTDTFQVSGRMPNNKYKLIINGNRYFDIASESWVTTNYTSEHDVKIIDYKIFNYSCHPEYIKLLYKHYSDLTGNRADSNRSQIHSKSAFNYYIDPSFSLLKSTVFVQGDLLSIGKHEVFNKQIVYGPCEIVNDAYIEGKLGVGINNPDEKLHVRGNIKSSGNLYLGFEDISTNGIYFKGYTGDVNPFYKHTAIEEKYYIDPADGNMTFPYVNQPSNTELLLFKGNDIHENKQDPKSISVEGSITDASWNNTQGDRIRLKAPNILFDTYNISNSNIGDETTRFEETHGMIFDQSGNLGINTLYAKQRLDVRGKINLQTDDRYDISSNIYISNTTDPDPLNIGYQNTGLGGKIFTKTGFDSSANTAIGYESQRDIETGYENTTVGNSTLTNNIIGYNNVAIGNKSLNKYTGNFNTSIGYGSQENNITGLNISVGYNSLNKNTTGTENIAIGNDSMSNSNGNKNIAIGILSLNDNDGSGNVAIGNYSQKFSDTSSYYRNTTLGQNSLENVSSNDNTAIGYYSMNNKKNGTNNVSVGSMSLEKNVHGNDNVAVGYKSMMDTSSNMSIAVGAHTLENTVVSEQVAIGYQSQQFATDSSGNVSVGSKTLKNNTVGNHNVAIGFESQTAFTGESNSHNTTIGYRTLHKNTDGKFNTAIGHESLTNNLSSHNNTSVGYDSLHENVAGLNNAFGAKSLYTNYDGTNNIALGSYSLYNQVSGSENIAIGNNSLFNNTESNNLSIGDNSLYSNTNGKENISLGNNSMYTTTSSNNAIALGFKSQENALDASSNISIGNYSLQINRSNQHDNIAIGHETMKKKLFGDKNIAIGNYSYSNNSDNPNHNGESNIAIGYQTMMDTSSNYSIAIGDKALIQSRTDKNLAIGYQSQTSSTTGYENTAVGYISQTSGTTGYYNVSLGGQTLEKNIQGNSNTAIGYKSMSDASGNHHYNTAIGINTMKELYDGTYNIAIGDSSMIQAKGGNNNTAIGINTMKELYDGTYNIAIGDSSMIQANGGNNNIAIGRNTMAVNTSGTKNNALGYYALAANTTGEENIGIGSESLWKNTIGNYNTSVGNYSLHENLSGEKNTALGYESLYNVISGNNNVSIGYQSQYLSNSAFNTSIGDFSLSQIITSADSSYNSAVGFNSLHSLKTGGTNIAMGYNSLSSANNSEFNIGIGFSAVRSKPNLNSNAGNSNIGIGKKAMYDISGGSFNVAIGEESMYDLREGGTHNVALGYQSLYGNGFNGIDNIAIGNKPLLNCTTGDLNVALGREPLRTNTTGDSNISIGTKTLHDNESGGNNIAIGTDALYSNIDTSYNIAVGWNTLYSNKENWNIAIGYESQKQGTTADKNTSLGHQALQLNELGTGNTAVGWMSQRTTNAGVTGHASYNTSLGHRSLEQNLSGKANVAIGSNALQYNNDNDYNVAVGYQALQMSTSVTVLDANGNTAIGHQSMKHHYSNAISNNIQGNTALGYKSLFSEHSGITQDNVAIGSHSMVDLSDNSYRNISIGNMSLSTGKVLDNVAIGNKALARENIPTDSITESEITGNVAIGTESLYQDVSGNYNVAIGYKTLHENHNGKNNIAIGQEALYNSNKTKYNIAIGHNALHGLSDSDVSDYNISIGKDTLKLHVKGEENIVIGNETANKHEEGDYNVIIGSKSAYEDISGLENTVIGYKSMYNNIDGKGNSTLGYKTGHDCKGDYNVIIGYEADIPGSGNTTTDDANGYGDYVDYSIAIGYQAKVMANENIAIGKNASVDFKYDTSDPPNRVNTDTDVSNSIAIGNNSKVSQYQSIAIGHNASVDEYRSTAIGVDAASNTHPNTIVIGETIPYKWLKHDHEQRTGDDKYYNPTETRIFNDTVKVCIGTQSYKDTFGADYKFRVDGSANITGNLKVDGNLIFTGDTIETIDHQVVRMSEQLDISNTGIAPALKITQYGSGTNPNDFNYKEGSIVEIYDGDEEFDDISNVTVFHIKNGGNAFFRNNVDISRNMIIYNETSSKNHDPNEPDPSYNHFTIGARPGNYVNHNAAMRNTRDFQDSESVKSQMAEKYPNRPITFLPPSGVTPEKRYNFPGSRSGTADITGQYSLEVSGNVFVHDYMKIETGRPFENSFEVHTTDGIQLPCGTTNERPGNYYYHANNPDPNINESVYPEIEPTIEADTTRYQVNNFTGNSSDGSIRYNTDTSQCEVYAGGNMWTGLAGYKTEQPPYLFKYDLGQSQTVSDSATHPIIHNGKNLSIEKTAFYADTAWRQLTTVYYDSFSGLPYPLYQYTVVDISTNSGWQLFKVLNGNVDETGNETTPDISYSFDGRVGINDFTTKTLAELPPYPEKPTIEASDTTTSIYSDETNTNIPFNQSGFLNLDPDLSYNVRVYALNKSRTKPKMIYLNNIYLLRTAYPDIVNFAFSNSGTMVGTQNYYPFQEYSQYGVKMNLSFERANIENVGTTNDNATKQSGSNTIFDPESTSYPSITHYNVVKYVTASKCMYDLTAQLTGGGFKNTLTTDMPDTTGYNISGSYGSNASPNSYQIVDEIHDLEQRNVEFRHTLLPGTKYAIKLNAKNNRNPYFSHDDEATVIDDETFDELKTPYIPPNGVQTTSIGGVTYAGEFPSNFTEMPYYTNVDGYRPDNGTDDPLYVKYISKDDLEAIDLSNITFGGHRTVAVFDPDEANHYKYIPYYNQHSNDSWGTGKYFDISGEENFYVNFNRQGTNCLGKTLATVTLKVTTIFTPTFSLSYNETLTYENTSPNEYIVHDARVIHNGVLTFVTELKESASSDINKGFVQTANLKIIPSTYGNGPAVGTTTGDFNKLIPGTQLKRIEYEIEADVSRDETNQGGYLDPSNNILQRTSVSPYEFYIDGYDAVPTKISNSATITVDSNNLLFCMGVPSSKLVSLNVNYTVGNYAHQFLPAVETMNDNGTIKTLISKAIINSIGVNSQKFGSQQPYDTDDIKNFIGIYDTYASNLYGDSTEAVSWPNIYLINNNDSVFYDTSTTDLTYQIIAYHLSNETTSTYDTVSLTSNEQTVFVSDEFTPAYPIWSDRKSFVKDSNGVISTLNPEVVNTYKPSGTGTNDWSSTKMLISNIIQENPASTTFTLHNRQLTYFDGKFGTPTHYASGGDGFIFNNFTPYNGGATTSSSNPISNLNGRGAQEYTWTDNKITSSNNVNLDGTDYNFKYVIFKIPESQHVTDTGLVDISNLLIKGQNLDHYIGADGTWSTELDGVFIWVAQEYNDGLDTSTYYGSVNKIFDPLETNWYLNPNNQDDIQAAYNSEAAARTIDNPHYIRINTDSTDEMYLIVALHNGTDTYVNFPI
jgi:hypothetical protein